MKKIDVIFGLFVPAASFVVPVVCSGNYNPSNSGVEGFFLLSVVGQCSPSYSPPSPFASSAILKNLFVIAVLVRAAHGDSSQALCSAFSP